jgi:hypothetical protein
MADELFSQSTDPTARGLVKEDDGSVAFALGRISEALRRDVEHILAESEMTKAIVRRLDALEERQEAN